MFSKIPQSLTRLVIMAIASLMVALITAIGVKATIRPTPSNASLSPTQIYAANHANFDTINSIAQATTVFIIPDALSQEGLEAALTREQKFERAGSGMLVAHKEATYYVLTNQHVTPLRGEYVIRTYDGELHQINNLGPAFETLGQVDQTDHIITRFGESSLGSKTVDGYDLAIVQFDSAKDYPIVPMGDSSRLSEGDSIFVSGWPLPQGTSANRRRVLREGQLEKVLNPADSNGNYSLCYTAETATGMSGGPVFNEQGEVIGIHGRGRTYSNPNCIDTSFGIQVNDFIKEQAERNRLNNYFLRPPVNVSEFIQVVANAINADTLKQENFKDLLVDPSDPAYQAINNLTQRYDGCMQPLDDGTWRVNRAATRGEFVVDLSRCLDVIVRLSSDTVSRSDFESVEQTVTELTREVARELESF